MRTLFGRMKMNLFVKYEYKERKLLKKGFIRESPAISALMEIPSAISAIIPSSPQIVWENPFPKGTPEARAESLKVVDAARGGEAI